MIVYHGSIVTVAYPDVLHSYPCLDFGKGFYVTTVREQAEKWARRKAFFAKNDAQAILNIYEMNDNLEGFAFKDFGDDLGSWVDFVCECRDGNRGYQIYDVIKGKVANDKVFRVVDMYHNGIWDKERTLKEIRVYPSYDQIAFITQTALDELLTFQSSQEVSQ